MHPKGSKTWGGIRTCLSFKKCLMTFKVVSCLWGWVDPIHFFDSSRLAVTLLLTLTYYFNFYFPTAIVFFPM